MKNIVKFELTKKQTAILKDCFEENDKETGAVVGQFMEANDGNGFVVACYIPREQAIKLQKVMGHKEGSLTPKIVRNVCFDIE